MAEPILPASDGARLPFPVPPAESPRFVVDLGPTPAPVDALLAELAAVGLSPALGPNGKLTLRGPRARITESLLARVREHKPALLARLGPAPPMLAADPGAEIEYSFGAGEVKTARKADLPALGLCWWREIGGAGWTLYAPKAQQGADRAAEEQEGSPS